MRERTAEIVRRLAERAEDVCRHYLSNGRKIGGYWIVGDRRNAKGRSLYLRLNGPATGKGARGCGCGTGGGAAEGLAALGLAGVAGVLVTRRRRRG